MYHDYPHVMEERPNPTPIDVRRLWAAVINQAKDDVTGVPDFRDRHSPHHKVLRGEQAVAWFRSERTDCGSFLWICGEVLHMDPATIRDRVLQTAVVDQPIPRGGRPSAVGGRYEIPFPSTPRAAALAGRRALPAV